MFSLTGFKRVVCRYMFGGFFKGNPRLSSIQSRSVGPQLLPLWYFTVTLAPYTFFGFIGFLIKAANSLIYSKP